MHDLVIRGGFLVDGTGAPGRQADVAVDDGTITEVAEAGAIGRRAATTTIDAEGLLVTPGWVDVHTHYDAPGDVGPVAHAVVVARRHHGRDGQLRRRLRAGRPRPSRVADRADGGRGGHPGHGADRGHVSGSGRSFEEYLDALDARHYVIDVGTQVAARRPARLRDGRAGRGERTRHRRPTSPRWPRSSNVALRAGALGFSTSRTPIHRSKSGELVPGTNAAADELYGIADALRRAGHGVFQFAPDHAEVPTGEWPWMRELARRTGRTVSVNLNQTEQRARPVARRAGPARRRRRRRHPDRRPGRRATGRPADVPRGQLPPARLPPGVPVVRRPSARRAGGGAAFARPAAGVCEVEPDDGGLFRNVVLDKLDQWLGGGRRRHRLRAATPTRRSARSPRRTGEHPLGLVIDQLLAARRPRHASSRRSSTTPTATSTSRTRRTCTPAPGWGWPTPAPIAA